MTDNITKLEYFAGLAMQAHITGSLSIRGVEPCPKKVAKESLKFAQELTKEINSRYSNYYE